MHVTVQPPPISMHGAQNVPAIPSIFKGSRQHLGAAVGTDDLEPGFQQTHRMKTGARCHVEHLASSMSLQSLDEEIALGFGTRVPVDQFIPLVDEPFNIFLGIIVGLATTNRIFTKVLLWR